MVLSVLGNLKAVDYEMKRGTDEHEDCFLVIYLLSGVKFEKTSKI